MPKYYVQSGPVQLIFDAVNAERAAVMAFQWTCDKQSEIVAATPLDHVIEAEERGWQLGEDIVVNEQGFDRWEGELFETRDIVRLTMSAATRKLCCKSRRSMS